MALQSRQLNQGGAQPGSWPAAALCGVWLLTRQRERVGTPGPKRGSSGDRDPEQVLEEAVDRRIKTAANVGEFDDGVDDVRLSAWRHREPMTPRAARTRHKLVTKEPVRSLTGLPAAKCAAFSHSAPLTPSGRQAQHAGVPLVK